jgi:aspartate aminotransferase
VSRLAFSATLALDSRAKDLERAGVDIVSMAVGEPDFETPLAARAAAIEAIEGNRTRYTPVSGTLELRRAIAAHLAATRGVRYDPAREITVCHSAKHALSGSLLALLEEGDEVLLLAPFWGSYSEIVRYAGGVPVVVPARADMGPDFEALEGALGPRTRGLLLNTPNNPTGYVWSRAEIEHLAKLAVKRDFWILSDEIYRRLVYEGEPNTSPVQVSAELRERTVIVDGASKAFAMTGYRIGYLAAPAPIAEAVATLHSQLTGCPNAVSQAAFERALRSEPPEVERMAAEFDRRRRYLLSALEELGLRTPRPRGAFYAFPDVSPWLDERGSTGFSEDLLESQALVVVPGAVFGADAHVRLSYATSMEKIAIALERLRKFLAR